MPRYRFKEWRDETGSSIGTTPAISVFIDKDKALTAYYEEVPAVTYTLTVNITVGGTTNPSPGTYTAPSGSTVQVTALPNSGYAFDHWSLDGTTRTENPIDVLMDNNHTLTAYFKTLPPPTYTLTINTTTGGTTSPSPGAYSHPQGTSVSITAIANSGYQFDHWILDGATRTENPITITINTNDSLTAYFTTLPPVQYTLTIATTTGGNTNPAPGTYLYNQDTSVIITATAQQGYRFVSWNLDGTMYTTNPITVVMNQNHTITANFEAIPIYTLDITAQTGGTTNPAPGSYQYAEGTSVSIQALPNSGYLFDHWLLDGASYTTNPISVAMNTNHTITAYFTALPPPQYTLTIQTSTGGTTNPTPGSYIYIQGSSVSVQALPSSDYNFDHWLLDGATRTENPITLIMNQNHSLTAYFRALPPPEYTLTISTILGGTTNPTPNTYIYPQNTNVQVTAIPDTNYNFDHWILDGTTYTTNPITVLMNTNHSLTAYFSEIPPPPPEKYNLNLNSTIGGSTDPPSGIYQETSGSTVTVTATPQAEMFFDHWELDGSIRRENPITVTMDKDHTLLAVFSATPSIPEFPKVWILIPVMIGGLAVVYLLTRKR